MCKEQDPVSALEVDYPPSPSSYSMMRMRRLASRHFGQGRAVFARTARSSWAVRSVTCPHSGHTISRMLPCISSV